MIGSSWLAVTGDAVVTAQCNRHRQRFAESDASPSQWLAVSSRLHILPNSNCCSVEMQLCNHRLFKLTFTSLLLNPHTSLTGFHRCGNRESHTTRTPAPCPPGFTSLHLLPPLCLLHRKLDQESKNTVTVDVAFPITMLFFFFWWDWGLNSGLYDCR
jgi:hypothetical protein